MDHDRRPFPSRQASLVGISSKQPAGLAASLRSARFWRPARGGHRRALVFDTAEDRTGDDRGEAAEPFKVRNVLGFRLRRSHRKPA
jgi:hypothetical protein